jgi:hypothetical protein
MYQFISPITRRWHEAMGTRDSELMSRARVIDGHVDLPIFVREAYGNDINKIELEKQVCQIQVL